MSALEHITVEGFKSIRAMKRFPLRQLNVLIGPNGSGKSNFLQVFSFLSAIRAGRLGSYVRRTGEADEILHFGSKATDRMTIHLAFENEVNQYEIILAPTRGGELYPESEAVFSRGEGYQKPYEESISSHGHEAGISAPGHSGIAKYVRQHLGSWRLYHFHDTSHGSPMKKASAVNDNRFLRPDGSNLAAFLYFLRERHEASYNLIRRTVRLVAPFFDDFLLDPLVLNEDKIRIEWIHKGSDAYFDVSSLSDGSLRFMALATLLLQPEFLRPSVIILDEPELGLHPYAITILASLFKHASVESQIIVATQSPLLLDHFTPEDVLVADRVNGETRFRRLDSAELQTWLADYSLGQLWEKNELGGRPASE